MSKFTTLLGDFFRRGEIVEDLGGGSPGGPANPDGSNRRLSYSVESALGIAAALGGVQLIANAAARSDLIIERRDRNSGNYAPINWGDYPRWADPDNRPNDYQSLPEFIRHQAACKLAGGNAYIYISNKDRTYRDGYPQTVISVPPIDISITTATGPRNPNSYRRAGDGSETVRDRMGNIWIGGVNINDGVQAYVNGHRANIYNARNRDGSLIHSKLFLWDSLLMGYSPFFVGAPSLQIGLEAEQHARAHFAGGGDPNTYLMAEEATQDKANEMFDKLQTHMIDPRSRHLPFVMAGKWTAWNSMVTPQQSELLDTRRFTVGEVARLLTIPLPLLASDQITTWGSGVRELIKFFTDITLTPFLHSLSGDLSQLLPKGMRVRLDPSHLRVEDLTAKAAYYSAALGGSSDPWLDINEVRELENLQPWDDAKIDEITNKPDPMDVGIRQMMDEELENEPESNVV